MPLYDVCARVQQGAFFNLCKPASKYPYIYLCAIKSR